MPSFHTMAAALICVILAFAWILPMEATHAWGWDETMHAELPALRILFSLQEGDFVGAVQAALTCNHYPFGYPVILAAAQGIFGTGEQVCRVLGTLLWCLTLFGLFLTGRALQECLARDRDEGRAAWIPWLALAFGATCPLALRYSGTLFLEIPFACAAVFALRAWLRRKGELSSRLAVRRDLAAGAWLTLCFFIKFNYGLLLWIGIFLDWALENAGGLRRKAFKPILKRGLCLALIPALSLALWFFWPFAGEAETGAVHRTALVSYLGANKSMANTTWDWRFLHLTGLFALNLRLLLVLLVGVVFSLRSIHQPRVRAAWAILLAMAVPVVMHPYHLDRFLIPVGVPLWLLAAAGWTTLLPAGRPARWRLLCALILGTFIMPAADTAWLAGKLGVLKRNPTVRSYQLEGIRSWCNLSGTRYIPSAGLKTGENRTFLDLVASAVRPGERVGGIGLIREVAPCGLLYGLYERGGTRRQFLDLSRKRNLLTKVTDLGKDPEGLRRFADRFDVIFTVIAEPWKGTARQAAMRKHVQSLTGDLGWKKETVGSMTLHRDLQPPEEITLFALRPASPE